ncbi:MAG: hypothetical protein JSU01_08150, partial [Bacteroidetes bacterium]|nr:hypothetical protein [Bacteroidota bacterium]
MRKKYGLLILSLFILSSCCKRDPGPNYPISGAKWQEVKLWIYHKTYHGLIFNDTTYTRSAFDFMDYVQFSNNGSVSRASHYSFSFHGGGLNSSFTPWRSLYLIDYTGFNADTVYYNGRDTLRIHSFQQSYPYLFYDEMDAYY